MQFQIEYMQAVYKINSNMGQELFRANMPALTPQAESQTKPKPKLKKSSKKKHKENK